MRFGLAKCKSFSLLDCPDCCGPVEKSYACRLSCQLVDQCDGKTWGGYRSSVPGTWHWSRVKQWSYQLWVYADGGRLVSDGGSWIWFLRHWSVVGSARSESHEPYWRLAVALLSPLEDLGHYCTSWCHRQERNPAIKYYGRQHADIDSEEERTEDRNHRIAHRIAEVELGSTPAICLATALRRPAAKIFRSESLDRIAHRASCRRSDIVHRGQRRRKRHQLSRSRSRKYLCHDMQCITEI